MALRGGRSQKFLMLIVFSIITLVVVWVYLDLNNTTEKYFLQGSALKSIRTIQTITEKNISHDSALKSTRTTQTIPGKNIPQDSALKSTRTIQTTTEKNIPQVMVLESSSVHTLMSTVFPNTTSLSFSNQKNCSGKIRLVIIVCSSAENFDRRVVIRETWGSIAKHNISMRLLFMVGSSSNDKRVADEDGKYGDMIQENFKESYQNLSLKSVALLKWVHSKCSSTQFILKSDDDMFINVPVLIQRLLMEKSDNFIMGFKFHNSPALRNRQSKWYVDKKSFSGDRYPDYASGTAYAMSQGALTRLYQSSKELALFWLEDIFITGLCAKKAKVPIIHEPKFSYVKRASTGCANRNVISSHGHNTTELNLIWKQIIKKNLNCTDEYGFLSWVTRNTLI